MTKSKIASITIRDVAKQAGVSVATVSRYLNHNAPVSEEVASRLESVMAELNYTPHATARSLATLKTHTIGLALMDIAGDFFAPLLSGIEQVTRENGFDLLISCTQPALRRPGFKLAVGPHNTDGLLVFADSLNAQDLAQLVAIGFPVVLIHQTPPEGLPISCVTVENKAASCKIVEHLILQHGRRQIVLLRGPQEQEDSLWREMGYRQALELHGIPFDESRVAPGDFERTIAHASILTLIAEGVPFDAVFAGDDEAAVGAMAALQEAGKRIPQDVAVVGFDDQRMAPYLTPSLTTVRAPTEAVGKEAACQLINLIRGGQAEPLTLLPTQMILRRSCGCAS